MADGGGEAVAAGDAAGRPPARALPWAELYASLPQTLFFAVMFHVFFQMPPPQARQDKAAAGGPLQGQAMTGAVPGGSAAVGMNQGSNLNLDRPRAPNMHLPMWQLGDKFDFHVYVSTSEEEIFVNNKFDGVEDPPHPNPVESVGKGGLLWKQTGLFFDTRQGQNMTFERNFTKKDMPFPYLNGSVYLHAYFTRTASGSRHQYDMGTADIQHGSIPLVLHAKRPKAKRTKNLISGDISEKDKAILAQNAILNITEEREDEIVPLWKPEMSLHLVAEVSQFPKGGLPQQMIDEMDIDDATLMYWPIVHMNDFWLMRSKMLPVNETLDELPLRLSFTVSERLKWLMTVQWRNSLEQQAKLGASSDKDQDEMKRIFLESNPWLLGVTAAVSILHSVFDFLAFKNDITFWRKVESMKGLSIRTIFTSIVTQSIIFLYLVDNEASWMILISSGVGLIIEIWKVKKAMNVTIDFSKYPYFKMENKDSYSSETLKYDQLAMKYLSYVLYPLSLGFSCYSLGYSQYKSWYSWLLSSAVGCVYTFGFIMMTPQLFINYKLKSVAHLPWRAMVYKFLNTIIDDLFAFVIKMPTLHRLSCFRDDIIFLIYLYQRWAYREDRTRVNEYGLVAKDMDEAMGVTDGKTSLPDGKAGEPADGKAAEKKDK